MARKQHCTLHSEHTDHCTNMCTVCTCSNALFVLSSQQRGKAIVLVRESCEPLNESSWILLPGRCRSCLGEMEDARVMWILSGRSGRCQGDVCPVWERWKMPGRCGSCLREVEDAMEMWILSRRGGRCQGYVDPV